MTRSGEFTEVAVILDFFRSLSADPDKLRLVEVMARNSGLEGAPQLRLNDRGNESLAPALHEFAASFGNPLDAVADIEGIQVFAFERRVLLRFEPADADRYQVWYRAHELGEPEQRAFERLMREEYGIALTPGEGRHGE